MIEVPMDEVVWSISKHFLIATLADILTSSFMIPISSDLIISDPIERHEVFS